MEVAPGPVWHTFFVAGAIVFRLVQSVRVVKNDALPTTPQGRLPGPVWHSLYRWIISQAADLLAFQTVHLITDNRDLLAATVSSTAGLSHWPMVTAWWKERIRYVGRMVNVPRLCLCLYRQTLVWTRCTQRGRAPIFWMRVFFFSQTSTLLSLCASHTGCGCHVLSLTPQKMKADSRQQSRAVQIASAQKRARSVDTGQATQQQPGPPIKLLSHEACGQCCKVATSCPDRKFRG